MKKIISLLLAAVMVVATFAVIAIPTAAVDGDWSVYTAWSQHVEGDGYSGVVHNIAGYEYVRDLGFQTISPSEEDSKNTTPYVLVQTTNKVNLKQGVYMKVRVDDFTYYGDSLFAFTVWDQQGVEAGKQGDDYGLGVEMLIRPFNEDYTGYDVDDRNTWPGAVNCLQWFSDTVKGSRVFHSYQTGTTDQSNLDNDTDGTMSWVRQDLFNEYYDEDGTPIFVLEIKWNPEAQVEGGGTGGYLEMYVNGAPAVTDFNIKMTEYFKYEDFMAHIGFTMYNSALGGKAKCTILEYGTSSEQGDWFVPDGDDSAEPIINSVEYADLAPATDITVGEPAIRLNGDHESSDTKGKPSAFNGNTITIDDYGFANIQADPDGGATISYRVNDDISYNVKDFPISLIITRNYCTCEYIADDDTGELIEECHCNETLKIFANAGNNVADNDTYSLYTFSNIEADEEAGIEGKTYIENFVDEEGNSYLYFMADWSDTASFLGSNARPLNGRIHGIRIDVDRNTLDFVDASRNNFDVCEIAFFRNVKEAAEYARGFIAGLCDEEYIPEDETEEDTDAGVEDDTDAGVEDDTDAGVEDDTDAGVEDNTDAGVEDNTEPTTEPVTEPTTEPTTEPVTEPTTEPTTEPATEPATEPEKETEAKTEANKKPAEKETEKNDDDKNVNVNVNTGCGGTVGFGTLAVVALAGAGLISFRKKKED